MQYFVKYLAVLAHTQWPFSQTADDAFLCLRSVVAFSDMAIGANKLIEKWSRQAASPPSYLPCGANVHPSSKTWFLRPTRVCLPVWHLDRFIRFCRARGRHRQPMQTSPLRLYSNVPSVHATRLKRHRLVVPYSDLYVRICRFGYNTWRDPMNPTVILEKLCKLAGLDPPLYQPGYVIVAQQRFYEQELVENEQGLMSIPQLLRRGNAVRTSNM